jgi:hypothetical protein
MNAEREGVPVLELPTRRSVVVEDTGVLWAGQLHFDIGDLSTQHRNAGYQERKTLAANRALRYTAPCTLWPQGRRSRPYAVSCTNPWAGSR